MKSNFAALDLAGESNNGPIRHHNEDNFLIYAPPGAGSVIAMVADGIGGHSRGEVASYICCSEMLQAARKLPGSQWGPDFLLETLEKTNRRIFDFNFRCQRQRPMGCTVVAAIFTPEKIYYAHAGDSRFYEFFRDGSKHPLKQLTGDHRPEGFRELQQEYFPHSSLISHAVGTARYAGFDTGSIERKKGAKYILCSDGLYNHLPVQMLTGIIGQDLSARQITASLVRHALLAGEKDNITVICAADTN